MNAWDESTWAVFSGLFRKNIIFFLPAFGGRAVHCFRLIARHRATPVCTANVWRLVSGRPSKDVARGHPVLLRGISTFQKKENLPCPKKSINTVAAFLALRP